MKPALLVLALAWTVHAEETERGPDAFAFELYARLTEAPGNLFCSPLSIRSALAMTYAGARGATAREMERVLVFRPGMHEAFGAALRDLGRAGEKRLELAVANSLWAQKDHGFLPAYLDLTRKHYDAACRNVDFVGATEAARKAINGWVEERTKRKIKELFKPGILRPTTRLVLANAVYFKAAWAYPFEPNFTKDRPFHLSSGETVSVPTMRRSRTFRYGEAEGLQVLELPYEGRRFVMMILLPKDLAAFEKGLGGTMVDAWVERMKPRQVDVRLPRFGMTCEYRLDRTLAAMGMPTAFGEQADFSGLDGTQELFISAVVHKAFVGVDERGTEAAAATGVAFGRKGLPPDPVLFQADRPFVFLIRDTKSGSILFLGRVSDPR